MSRSRIYLAQQEPLVTVEQYMSTYRDTNSHGFKRSLEFLREKDLLPLTYHSRLLPQLNKLAAALRWSGNVTFNDRRYSPTSSISLDDRVINLIAPALSQLECDITPQNASNNLGESGAAYGRLLCALPGFYVNRGEKKSPDKKGRSQVSFPEYLTFILNHYRNILHEDKQLVRQLIRDEIDILLAAKTVWDSVLSMNMHLFYSKNKETAESYGELVVRMFNSAYPRMDLDLDSVETRSTEIEGETRFRPRIRFKEEALISGFRYYRLFLQHDGTIREHKELRRPK